MIAAILLALSILGAPDAVTPTAPDVAPPITAPVVFAPTGGASSIRTATATWYCLPGKSRCTRGYGPSYPGVAVTPDMGIGKGTRVRVCRGSRCTFAAVIDCSCHGTRNGIDLYASVWRRLGVPLSAGRMTVTVEAVGHGIAVPPPTSTENGWKP